LKFKFVKQCFQIVFKKWRLFKRLLGRYFWMASYISELELLGFVY